MNKNVKRTLLAVMVSSMLAASFATLSVSADDTATDLIFSENGEMASLGETDTDPISEAVWKIGDTGYATLAEAVEAAPADGTLTTIVLQKSLEGPGVVVKEGQNIVFDFNGNTYTINGTVGSTGTETNGFQLLKDSTVTMKNGTIESGTSKILIQNYCDLTLENIDLDASESSICQYVISNNYGKTIITGNTDITAAAGQVAFDVYYWPKGGYGEGVTVIVNKNMTGTITGKVEYTNDSTKPDEWFSKASLTIENGNFNIELKPVVGNNAQNANINISGGSFSGEVPADYLADTVEATVKTSTDRMAVYTDLQEAVNDAASGSIITVRQNGLSAKVDPSKGIRFVTAGDSIQLPTLTDLNDNKVEIDENGSTVQTKFTATINGQSKFYPKGETVTITTPAYYQGHIFKKWVVSSYNVNLDDPDSPSTFFTMPAENVTVYAVYDEITFVPVIPEQPTVTAPARDGWVKIGARWYLYDNGTKLTGWQKDGNTWYYLDEKGVMLCNGLAEIDGKTYYFYDWGGMASAWWHKDEDGNWYYFRGNGAMAISSWIEWKGEYYYVGADGKMLTNTTTPDGYRVDANGVWIR